MPISSQSAHIDGPLSNFSVAFLQDLTEFAATRVAPTITVANQSNSYPIWTLESLLKVQSGERDEGTEAPLGSLEVSRDTYFCTNASLKLPVTDEGRSNADEALELEQSVAEAVTLDVAQTQEIRMTNSFLVDNVWFNGGDAATTAATADFSDVATSNVIGTVETARRNIQAKTGIRPNRLLVGPAVWDAIKNDEKIIEKFSGGATTSQVALTNRDLAARVLELDSIEVAGGVAQQGTADAGFVVGNKMLLYYAPQSAGRRTTTAMTRFVWQPMGSEVAIKRYREERLSSDMLEANLFVDFKVNAGVLGHLWNVTTA